MILGILETLKIMSNFNYGQMEEKCVTVQLL